MEPNATEHRQVVEAVVREHRDYAAGYRLLVLHAPRVASHVVPGQFVHVLVPGLEASVLRRPFSVFTADDESLAILYKAVGRGTCVLSEASEGRTVSVLGPLGNGFPPCPTDAFPVLAAGGYGVAPLFLFATRTKTRGALFVGGQTSDDILCTDAFNALGWDVHVATEDGSLGVKGLVTDALDPWLERRAAEEVLHVCACGPDGMLRAVGERCTAVGREAWLSLDKHMGCGVGACLACVQKVRSADGSIVWARVCTDGPIFAAREVVWE